MIKEEASRIKQTSLALHVREHMCLPSGDGSIYIFVNVNILARGHSNIKTQNRKLDQPISIQGTHLPTTHSWDSGGLCICPSTTICNLRLSTPSHIGIQRRICAVVGNSKSSLLCHLLATSSNIQDRTPEH